MATVLCELGNNINADALSKVVEQGDVEVTVAQRLGYLLDTLNLPIDLTPLGRVLKNKKPKQKFLVTGSTEPVIECNHRWSILVNEQVDPDEL